MQIHIVMWVLLAFFAICGIFAVTASSSDWLKWFAGVGVLLTWTCQDTIKDIVAYIVLELNEMIKIGDWIIIEKLGIDGEVYDISITSVIVKNWDETLSTISTRTLLDTNMQNLQDMVDKKTSGRRMQRNFLINVHSIRDLSTNELDIIIASLTERHEDASAILYANEQGMTQNLEIYRIYLRHWLLEQESVIRSPKFAIRLLDQSPEGLPMQLYAFLLPTKWEEFEQEQARIVQHVISSLVLFGLVLFQYPGGTDTSKIHLVKGE